MYNWKSCSINGTPIVSLKLNGNLVWEKLPESTDSPIYYFTAPIDPDEAIEVLSGPIDFNSLIKIENQEDSFPSTEGLPVLFVKKGANSVTLTYHESVINSDVFLPLRKGVLAYDADTESVIEGVYDVEPDVTINGQAYELWVDCENWIFVNKNLQLKAIIT